MFIVNPDTGVNRDIPNMQAAFASAYYKCRVIDQNTMPKPADRFLNINDSDMVISVRSLNITEAERVKKTFLEKKPDGTVRSLYGFLDIQCCYPFVNFDEKLGIDTPFSDEYPFPDYELFDSFEIFKKSWNEGKWPYPVMTSLGCPFSCIYCASRNRKYHTRSVDHCIEEIKNAKDKWNFSSFQILDDCFNVEKNRVIEFCEKIKPFKLSWYCTNGLRADLFDEEIAKALKESGCQFISFGIESIEPDILLSIKKGETYEQIESAVTAATKYFDNVNGYFIIGLPGSTYKKDLKALEWAKRHRINSHFSFFVPGGGKLPADCQFYGEKAEPRSDSYPKEQQMKLYEMTKTMRAGYNESIIRRGLRKISGILGGSR